MLGRSLTSLPQCLGASDAAEVEASDEGHLKHDCGPTLTACVLFAIQDELNQVLGQSLTSVDDQAVAAEMEALEAEQLKAEVASMPVAPGPTPAEAAALKVWWEFGRAEWGVWEGSVGCVRTHARGWRMACALAKHVLYSPRKVVGVAVPCVCNA